MALDLSLRWRHL